MLGNIITRSSETLPLHRTYFFQGKKNHDIELALFFKSEIVVEFTLRFVYFLTENKSKLGYKHDKIQYAK